MEQQSMKTKLITLSSIAVVLILAGCSRGLGGASSSGPLNTNYSNAVSIPEQLILGTFKLEDTDLAVTPEEAAQLIPLWQAYESVANSDSASQQEVDATINQIQETMSPEQVQAIAGMKLTSQDTQTVFQSQGFPGGAFGNRNGGTPAPNGQGSQDGGFPGGGFPGGGFPSGPGDGAGGFGSRGAGATPNAQAMATFQARRSSGRANEGLVNVLIRFLQTKAGIATPTRISPPTVTPTP
jgi:uncharacterized membrane protein YgcG